jgi:hypothetical protein
MPDNKLQMYAELIDRVSPNAKKMQRAFEDLQRATGKQLPEAFKRYQSAVNQNERALANYGKSVLSTGRELKSFQEMIRRTSPAVAGLTDAFGAFSIGAGTAVGAVTAVGTAMAIAIRDAADFAEKLKALKYAAAEAGVGIVTLKRLQDIAPHYNISAERMAAGMEAFGGKMLEAHRNAGQFRQEMVQTLGGAIIPFTGHLLEMAKGGASVTEEFTEFNKVVDELHKKLPASEADRLSKLLAGFLGFPEAGRMGFKETSAQLKNTVLDIELWKEANKNAEHFDETMQQAYRSQENWANLWRRDTIPGLDHIVEGMTKVSESARKIVEAFEKLTNISAWKIFAMALNPVTGGASGAIANILGGLAGGGAAPGGGPQPSGGGGGPYGGLGAAGGYQGGVAPGGGRSGTIGNVLGGGPPASNEDPNLSGGGAPPMAGSGGATPFAGRFGTWSPGALRGRSGFIPSGATGPLGSLRTGGANIGGGGIPPGAAGAGIPFAAGGGAAYVAARRAPFAQELENNPQTRELLAGIISAENPGAGPAVAESLMNRTELVNQHRAQQGLPPLTLRDMIVGHPSIDRGRSFYGPMRSGAIHSHLARVRRDPAYRARMNRYIDEATAGSFTTQGYTDQGSANDPNYVAGGVGVNINRERFNNWGYPGSRAFHEEYVRRYRERAAAGQQQDRSNLNAGMTPAPAQIEGGADINMRIHGPPNVSVRAGARGIFKNINTMRNIQLPDVNSPVPQQTSPFA